MDDWLCDLYWATPALQLQLQLQMTHTSIHHTHPHLRMLRHRAMLLLHACMLCEISSLHSSVPFSSLICSRPRWVQMEWFVSHNVTNQPANQLWVSEPDRGAGSG
jgi:hypothetical protein